MNLDIINGYLLMHGKGHPGVIYEWRKNYPRQVESTQRIVKKIINTLDEHGILDKSLVLVTSDHGQLLGEYGGMIGHIAFLYDELTRIPLAVKYPETVSIKSIKDTYGKWLSATRFKKIVLDAVRGRIDENEVYNDTIYAESFGIHSLEVERCKSLGTCRFLRYRCRRVAVYSGSCKVVYSIDENRVEETRSYEGMCSRSTYQKLVEKAVRHYIRVSKLSGHGI